MNKILLFAGTTEGRNLAEFLEKNQIPTEVCVATQYGETLLEEGKYLHVHAGRLDETEMEQQIQKQKITLVIDATHPYAVIVSQNIRRACSRTGTEYIRLARKETDASWKQEMEDVIEVASVAEAAAFLAKKEGRIFAATGSKELSAYQVIPDYQDRVVARVLSTPEAVSECAMLGFSGKNLICMQGPFTEDLNVAMLRQAQASWMVTKESGKAGGFLEKLRAAKKAGAKLVVIKRPGERSEEIEEDQKEENLYAICDEGQIRSLLGKRLGICPKRQLYLINRTRLPLIWQNIRSMRRQRYSYPEISVFTAEQKNCTMRLNARKDWNRWKFTRSAAFLRWSISAENWAFPGRMSIF